MLSNARALFLGFLAAIVAVGLSDPGAPGVIALVFLMIGAISNVIWGVCLYLKIRRKDPNL